MCWPREEYRLRKQGGRAPAILLDPAFRLSASRGSVLFLGLQFWAFEAALGLSLLLGARSPLGGWPAPSPAPDFIPDQASRCGPTCARPAPPPHLCPHLKPQPPKLHFKSYLVLRARVTSTPSLWTLTAPGCWDSQYLPGHRLKGCWFSRDYMLGLHLPCSPHKSTA